MIDFDRINKWLALVANLGILVGLIFIGLEIQQNTIATKISSLDSTLSQYNHFREHIIRDRKPLATSPVGIGWVKEGFL